MGRATRRAVLSIPVRALALAPLLSTVSGDASTQVFATASFRDRSGFFIENLAKDEVQVFENNEPRTVEFLAGPEMQAVYGIVVDRAVIPDGFENQAGVVRGTSPAAMLQNIAYEMIDKLLGKQPLWVGSYGHELEIHQDFTREPFEAKDAIQRIRGSRTTSDSFLYSALYSAITKMTGRSERRRVILVLLGHIDSGTISKGKALKNLLGSAAVEVFIVSSASRLTGRDGVIPAVSDGALADLATATAGDYVRTPPGLDHPEDAVRTIGNQIRNFYTVGYESTGTTDKPAKLTIRCTRTGARVKHHPVSPLLG
jgi:hypothetical protein